MNQKNNNLIFDVEDKPAFSKLLVFALQQVLAVIAATIAVPTIIGLPVQIPAAILGAGLGTLVYLLFTKFKSPVIISSSFAFLGALGNALAYGYLGIITGSIFAGLVYVVLALIIKIAGTKWVSKLMPPVIIGPTVALIGLSLAGSAMGDIVKASADSINGSYNLIGLLCGLITFFTVIICTAQKRRQMPRLIPFIIGICTGYIAAAIFTVVGTKLNIEYFKIVNFDPIINNFAVLAAESNATIGEKIQAFVTYPDFALIEGVKELINKEAQIDGAQFIDLAGLIEVAIAFIPVALVVFAEHIADHKNLGSIIGRDLVGKEPGLARTLMGDGVGSIVGTVFGICPNTTYGESVGCVAITKNASVRTILVASIMCIILSFLSPIMCLLQTIPSCVMGGVCLTLYGFIAVSGLKMFKDIDLGENINLFTVSAILIAGIGGLAIKIPYAFDGNGLVTKVITITSIATALILGIITHAVMSVVGGKKAKKEEPVAPIEEVIEPVAPIEEPIVEEVIEEPAEVVPAQRTVKVIKVVRQVRKY